MAVVRHAQAESLVRDAIVLDLGDLAQQAEALKARAQAEADQIIAAGKAERDRLIAGAAEKGQAEGLARGLEEGRVRGFEEGRAQAHAELRDAGAALLASWQAAIDSFEQEREALRSASERDLVELAAQVIRRVTHRVIELNASTVQDQLAHVLQLVLDPSGLVIEVHPDDVVLCNEALPGLLEGRAESGDVKIREQAELSRGSVIVRTKGGGIDASIDGQIERIVAAMIEPSGGASEP